MYLTCCYLIYNSDKRLRSNEYIKVIINNKSIHAIWFNSNWQIASFELLVESMVHRKVIYHLSTEYCRLLCYVALMVYTAML